MIPLEVQSKSKKSKPRVGASLLQEIVMIAVSANGLALRYAGGELKDDSKVVLKAVAQNADSIEFVGDKLYNDSRFMKKLVKKFPGTRSKLRELGYFR